MTSEELKNIEDVLLRLDGRLAALETRVATSNALTARMSAAATRAGEGSADAKLDGDPSSGVDTEVEGTTASLDSDYWAAAVQVGLALSQGGGMKGWQTAVAALLPAVAQGVDHNNANKPVLKAALVPAALSGAAYYVGRFATR